MARAEVIVIPAPGTGFRNSQSTHLVDLGSGTQYLVYVDSGTADVFWVKTTNYGLTWSVPVNVVASTIVQLAVWFDKWTPGDAGTVIHIAYIEGAGGHDVLYRALDTNGDGLGTQRTVFNGASGVGGANSCLSITKSKAGRILVGFDMDGGTEIGTAKSDDFPVTAFSAIADVNDGGGATDYYLLLPGNESDTADIWAVYWDRSADELTLKTYDDSGNTWSESSAFGTSMVDVAATTVAPQFSATIRTSDGHAILSAWTNSDTLNADLKAWDINGAASITALTDVVLNSVDDQGACAMSIDSTNNNLYAFYLGKSDGTETAYTSINVYYKTSADGGTTWGSETLASDRVRATNSLVSCPIFYTAGEWQVIWHSDTTAGFSLRNSAILPATGGGSDRRGAMNGGVTQ